MGHAVAAKVNGEGRGRGEGAGHAGRRGRRGTGRPGRLPEPRRCAGAPGYVGERLEAVLCGNLLRLFREALPVA
jgi:hypothetical protein